MTRPVPDSLLSPGLAPVWKNARRQLDRFGSDRRGTVAQAALDAHSAHVLETLLGRKPTKRVDLVALEQAFVERGVGANLCEALTRLGLPPSAEARERRTMRERSTAARQALAMAIGSWRETWASQWAENIRRAGLLRGLDGRETIDLIADVRRLIDHLDQLDATCASRTELAAALFGSAHALDRDKRLATLVTRALRYRIGDGESSERELWEKAGVARDRVSAPALVWSIPTNGTSFLDRQLLAATEGKLPVHISLYALRRYPVTVRRDTPVLVVENPRMVEAAVERALPGSVVAGNGNPSAAVIELLVQLQQSGASLRYHGDFDAAGIAICRRMSEFGLTPWMMNALDYERAIRLAERNRVRLRRAVDDCGATPWDNALQAAYQRRRLIIHEEFVLDDVLGKFQELL